MSRPLRVALVAEGVTDFHVLHAAIEAILGTRPFILKLLQPEESSFTSAGAAGDLGGGWHGVFKWLDAWVDRTGGSIASDVVFSAYDLLVLHLDADVAGQKAPDFLPKLQGLLPCAQPCPPASASTNALRLLVQQYVGTSIPPRTAFCIPSTSTEAWVLKAIFPKDKQMEQHGWECHRNPAGRLAAQPKKTRFPKSANAYELRRDEIRDEWTRVSESLTEAGRFQRDFLASLSP